MDKVQIIITLALFLALIIPLSNYLYKVMEGERCKADSFFDRVDGFVFKLVGLEKKEMHWKQYVVSMLITNAVMAILCCIMLMIQGINIFNPNGIKNMTGSVAFNTISSFITNTNLQHYSGESQLSNLSQMLVITCLMFTSAATGLSIAAAFMRGIIGKNETVGNFHVDFVRIITRVLIPISIMVSIVLMAQGVPQTLSGVKTVNTIEGKLQDIALGPVASLESIKHLGTNGGGFFSANSAHPFENPTPIANVVEMLSMMAIPGATVLTFGRMLKNKKQAWSIFSAMLILFLLVLPACYMAEKQGNPHLAQAGLSQSMGNMEGKEMRFGIPQSTLFTTVTTAFTTGTVNNMHDTLTPMGGFVPLWNMMLNVVFGGEGVGFMNMAMYAMLTVFLAGLMVGRTPEFLGKKLEGKEVKLIAIAIIIHPFIILMPSALAFVTQSGMAGISNPGHHGFTQIIYEFTSAAANNGSGFEGLKDATLFWNASTGIVMLVGRYASMVLLMAVAGSLAAKKRVPKTTSTFRTDDAMFTVLLIAVVVIIGGLTFFPALALGPIAEHLAAFR